MYPDECTAMHVVHSRPNAGLSIETSHGGSLSTSASDVTRMCHWRELSGVAVQNVERSRTSKVSGSCQKVSGSWRRLARHYGPRLASLECIPGPGCRSTSF